jgi:hypothetical protein
VQKSDPTLTVIKYAASSGLLSAVVAANVDEPLSCKYDEVDVATILSGDDIIIETTMMEGQQEKKDTNKYRINVGVVSKCTDET